jgi:hypothetical protein
MTARLTADDHEAIRRIIRQEVLLDLPHEMPRPPPGDAAAEQILLAAVLNGEHKPADFPGLGAEHFSEPIRGACWGMACAMVTAGHEPRLEPILTALQEQGFAGPIADHLLRIRDKSPSVALIDLREYAARVVELWRRRRLLECMGQLRAELQCGACDWQDARSRLERHIVEYAP